MKVTCGNCAYYIDNLFYGYQVYCTHPTEFWLNPMGWIVLILFIISTTIFIRRHLTTNGTLYFGKFDNDK